MSPHPYLYLCVCQRIGCCGAQVCVFMYVGSLVHMCRDKRLTLDVSP